MASFGGRKLQFTLELGSEKHSSQIATLCEGTDDGGGQATSVRTDVAYDVVGHFLYLLELARYGSTADALLVGAEEVGVGWSKT